MSSFHERQKNLFNHLKDAEDQCGYSSSNRASPSQDYNVMDRQTYRKIKHQMKQFRGRESIFKRSQANIRECLRAKTIPDYLKNPQKWVYYSLSDVTPEQMSDSTNTATALAFIKEMEKKEAEKTKMENDSQDDFIFKKPTFYISATIKKHSKPNEESKAVFKSNKVIMPEYVVGVSQKKENSNIKKMSASKDSSNSDDKKLELKLNHLYDEDDETD